MWWLQPPCWASRGCFLPRSKAVAKRQRSSADAQACRRIVGPSGLDRCTAAGCVACVHPCAPRRQHQTLRGWRWLRVTSERVLEQPEHTLQTRHTEAGVIAFENETVLRLMEKMMRDHPDIPDAWRAVACVSITYCDSVSITYCSEHQQKVRSRYTVGDATSAKSYRPVLCGR